MLKTTTLTGLKFPEGVLSSRFLINSPASTRRPGTSLEGFLKVLTSGTSRGSSGDSQGTNTKIDDLMKKVFLNALVLVSRIYFCFYWKSKYSKVLNGNVHGTSMGPSCGTSRGPNDGTFWRRPRDVGHTCFLNPTEKHIKHTLTGYSRLFSELQQQKIQ